MKIKAELYNKLKKILRITLSVLFAAAFIALLGAASYHQDQQPIKGYHLQIMNQDGSVGVLDNKEIKEWILESYLPLDEESRLKKEVDLKQIERRARLNPWISNAEVYIDNNQKMRIEVYERKPIVRIFDQNGNSFLMDSTKAVMPLIPMRHFSVPVFSNVFISENDSMSLRVKEELIYMAELIGRDSFWNAQIAQISVNPNRSFVLVPVAGNDQKILFGDTSRAVEKLENLMAFYKQVIPKVGWDSYKVLDLTYKDQIIARPTLGVSIVKNKNKRNN